MEEYRCVGENCIRIGRKITWGEYNFSMNVFRKALCLECQLEEREKTHPPKLAKFINDEVKKKFNLK